MTLPTRPRDGYLAALAAIAPNAARLKEAYGPTLGRSLIIAVNIHLLALGGYWVATVALRADTAEAAPINDDLIWIPTTPNFPSTPPDIVPKPPSTGGSTPTQAAASGVVNLVDDTQVDPAATIATADEMSTSPSGPVTGTATQGDGSGEPGAGTRTPQVPAPPVVEMRPPPVPQPDPVVETPQPTNEVIEISEISPEIIGGIAGVQARVTYPRFDREIGNQGTVVVRFVVEPSGEPSGIEVARSVTPGLDAAAVAAVRQTRFTPGIQNGRPVRVRMSLPVRFTIH